MKLVLFMILYLLVFYVLAGHVLVRRLLPKHRRRLHLLRDYERHLRRLRRINRDILTPAELQGIDRLVAEVRETRLSPPDTIDGLTAAVAEADTKAATVVPQRLREKGTLAEYVEVLVVALALAFAVRALFLQPFKIPTGSMQPTLFGIHYVDDENLTLPNPAVRFFDYLHFSRRYVDVTIEQSGRFEGMNDAASLPFLPATTIRIGGVDYRLPGTPLQAFQHYLPDKLRNFLQNRARGVPAQPPMFEQGEVLARGYMKAGDHVFVNRLHLNFKAPRRGDVIVFLTDDIATADGESLSGRYYIKRLVGLPGDLLRIDADHRLHVKPAGEDAFRVLDETFDPAFGRIYSMAGGYHGYVHPPSAVDGQRGQYLTGPDDLYEVPNGHCFLLGDNSHNSQDSRYWGAVPMKNLVSRAALVWWPVSVRWGAVDRISIDDVVEYAKKAGPRQ